MSSGSAGEKNSVHSCSPNCSLMCSMQCSLTLRVLDAGPPLLEDVQAEAEGVGVGPEQQSGEWRGPQSRLRAAGGRRCGSRRPHERRCTCEQCGEPVGYICYVVQLSPITVEQTQRCFRSLIIYAPQMTSPLMHEERVY